MQARAVFLYVASLPDALAFYEAELGLKRVAQPAPDCVYLSLPPISLYLHAAPAGMVLTMPQAAILQVDVDEIDALYARLRSSGRHSMGPLRVFEDGKSSFTIRDPDGHPIAFWSN